jgi:hypothetical protein
MAQLKLIALLLVASTALAQTVSIKRITDPKDSARLKDLYKKIEAAEVPLQKAQEAYDAAETEISTKYLGSDIHGPQKDGVFWGLSTDFTTFLATGYTFGNMADSEIRRVCAALPH